MTMTNKDIPILVPVRERRPYTSLADADGRFYVEALVSEGGTVRTWDPIAGHFTAVHSLPADVVARARQLADARRGKGVRGRGAL